VTASSSRYTRQVRLDEVGELGQARLSAATLTLDTSRLAGAISERYLTGAGVAVVAGQGTFVPPEPSWLADLEPAAGEVAAGALQALAFIKAVLGGESSSQ
jgi:hypothetical protein